MGWQISACRCCTAIRQKCTFMDVDAILWPSLAKRHLACCGPRVNVHDGLHVQKDNAACWKGQVSMYVEIWVPPSKFEFKSWQEACLPTTWYVVRHSICDYIVVKKVSGKLKVCIQCLQCIWFNIKQKFEIFNNLILIFLWLDDSLISGNILIGFPPEIGASHDQEKVLMKHVQNYTKVLQGTFRHD